MEPEIPQNCGNIARTCAATHSVLHLIRPLGFDISEKAVRRAGLDYWSEVDVRVYENLEDFFAKIRSGKCGAFPRRPQGVTPRLPIPTAASCSSGRSPRAFPEEFLEAHRQETVRIPMFPGIRSLNLSNSVAVTVYEALRQLDFPGLQDHGKMRENSPT